MNENILENLKLKVAEFRDNRDWKQFHSPKNIAMALSVEASELAELFLWDECVTSFDTAKTKKDALQEEMADVLIYLLSMADVLDIDLEKAVIDKLKKNSQKYPIEKSKGSCKKYTEL